jgi:hypothetical protein
MPQIVRALGAWRKSNYSAQITLPARRKSCAEQDWLRPVSTLNLDLL